MTYDWIGGAWMASTFGLKLVMSPSVVSRIGGRRSTKIATGVTTETYVAAMRPAPNWRGHMTFQLKEDLLPRPVTVPVNCPDSACLLEILGDAYGSGHESTRLRALQRDLTELIGQGRVEALKLGGRALRYRRLADGGEDDPLIWQYTLQQVRDLIAEAVPATTWRWSPPPNCARCWRRRRRRWRPFTAPAQSDGIYIGKGAAGVSPAGSAQAEHINSR